MKRKIVLIGITSMLLTSCYNRIGDLNLVSNRNLENLDKYELIQRDLKATCKTRKNNAMEIAIDEMVESVSGEFLMNAKISVKFSGRKIKVEGDVWGYKKSNN